MDGPGFHVDIGVLESAAGGVRDSVADQHGSALADLDRAAGAYGHGGVHKAMENFCDRWNDGVDILTKDAGVIADVLSAVAKAYRASDGAAAARLTGDPGTKAVDD